MTDVPVRADFTDYIKVAIQLCGAMIHNATEYEQGEEAQSLNYTLSDLLTIQRRMKRLDRR